MVDHTSVSRKVVQVGLQGYLGWVWHFQNNLLETT